MANEKNLIPFTADQSREEAKKNGRKGGRASGEARRKQRTYREVFNALRDLEIEVPMPDGTKVKKRLDEAEMIALHRRAAAGDTRALKLVLDMTGEIEQNINVSAKGEGFIVTFKD